MIDQYWILMNVFFALFGFGVGRILALLFIYFDLPEKFRDFFIHKIGPCLFSNKFRKVNRRSMNDSEYISGLSVATYEDPLVYEDHFLEEDIERPASSTASVKHKSGKEPHHD